MTWVVDASVALKWAVPESDSDLAHALIFQDLIAPDWWIIEAGNGLWKRVGRGELTVDEASALCVGLSRAPIAVVESAPLVERALKLAGRLSHPIYDCLYLALALERDLTVVTADNRFQRVVGQHPDLADHVVSLISEAWR